MIQFRLWRCGDGVIVEDKQGSWLLYIQTTVDNLYSGYGGSVCLVGGVGGVDAAVGALAFGAFPEVVVVADGGDKVGVVLFGTGFVVSGECFGGGVVDAQFIGDLNMGFVTSTRLPCSCITFWKKISLVLRGILWYLFLFLLIFLSVYFSVSPPSSIIQSVQIKLNITEINLCNYLLIPPFIRLKC
jgi:hypothetical protein